MRKIPRVLKFTVMSMMLAGLISAPATGAPLRILALGDSLTQGYGVPPGAEFPAQLEKTLKARGHDVVVVNGGTSGDTSAGGHAALEWMLAAGSNSLPDAAIVELGANDGLRGLPPAAMEKNLDAILALLKKNGVPALLTGMKAPRNMGADYAAQYDAVFPRLAGKYSVMFYPFFLEGVALNASLNQPDLIHPNPKGVAEIVKRMLPSVEKLLAQARAHKPT